MIFGKRTDVHSKLYKVYKGSDYLNQYTSPVHQYTTPTTSQHNYQPTKTIILEVILVEPALQPPNHPKPSQKRLRTEGEHLTRKGEVQRAASRNRKALIFLICTNRFISR